MRTALVPLLKRLHLTSFCLLGRPSHRGTQVLDELSQQPTVAGEPAAWTERGGRAAARTSPPPAEPGTCLFPDILPPPSPSTVSLD